ncbi:energy transducer TonB [Candidatus Jorgensenbacteria bacterium]|nr:energy transducer TonB [Candidatus Jorgensenbacteria bacterium]
MSDAIVATLHRNGADVRRRTYQRNFLIGLVLATMLHLLIVGSYYLTGYLSPEDEPVMTVRIMKYSELGPPPSITSAEATPQVAVTVPIVKPTIGMPVPVPDAEVNPEQTIATQKELSEMPAPVTGQEGIGAGGVKVEQDIRIEDEEPPDFVPVEKLPIAIKQVAPTYPELARRAGIEGTVWVKIWVDKEGRPKKVVVTKSDADIFNEEATKAAMQWLFAPAIMNNGPVSVWVSIPFRFNLNR